MADPDGFVLPTVDDFDTFLALDPEYDEGEFTGAQETFLIRTAADLMLLATGMAMGAPVPDSDSPIGRMITNGILDMAYYLGSSFDDRERQQYSPYSSEILGCVDDKTTILTREHGWVTQDKLEVGDTALTINPITGLSEWQQISCINRFEPTRRKVLFIDSKRFSSLTSLNHRWLIKDVKKGFLWKKSHELTSKISSNWRIPRATNHGEFVETAKYSDALVELVAWFWTEGGYKWKGHHGGISIHQSLKENPDNCARIRKAMAEVFGPPSESLVKRYSECKDSNTNMAHWRDGSLVINQSRIAWTERTRRNGEMAEFVMSPDAAPTLTRHLVPDNHKAVSTEFLTELTESQLELFIKISLLADRSNSKQLAQKSREGAEQFALACILSGRRVSIHKNKYDMWVVTFGTNVLASVSAMVYSVSENTKFGVVDFDGMLWCPTVPNGTWLARREGTVYYTGNSYSYTKSLKAVNTKTGTGVPLFDMAVTYFSAFDAGDDVSGQFAHKSEDVFGTSFADYEKRIERDAQRLWGWR